jgi:hypothetical protein
MCFKLTEYKLTVGSKVPCRVGLDSIAVIVARFAVIEFHQMKIAWLYNFHERTSKYAKPEA